MIAPRVLAAAAVVGGAIGPRAGRWRPAWPPAAGWSGRRCSRACSWPLRFVAVPKQGPASRLLLAAAVAAVVGAFAARGGRRRLGARRTDARWVDQGHGRARGGRRRPGAEPGLRGDVAQGPGVAAGRAGFRV